MLDKKVLCGDVIYVVLSGAIKGGETRRFKQLRRDLIRALYGEEILV